MCKYCDFEINEKGCREKPIYFLDEKTQDTKLRDIRLELTIFPAENEKDYPAIGYTVSRKAGGYFVTIGAGEGEGLCGTIPIRYCPFCGRELEGANNAKGAIDGE